MAANGVGKQQDGDGVQMAEFYMYYNGNKVSFDKLEVAVLEAGAYINNEGITSLVDGDIDRK
jgi:hypothetical protein